MDNPTNAGKDGGEEETQFLGVGNQHRGFKWKKKLKIDLPYDPDIAL